MKIPFLDLRAQYNLINQEVQASIQDVFNDTAFASGPYVEKFETGTWPTISPSSSSEEPESGTSSCE